MGAVAIILTVVLNIARIGEIDIVWQAVIVAVVVAAMCWVGARRAIAVRTKAIDAAIQRMARAASGDLESDIPPEVGKYIPTMSKAMADLFAQLSANMTNIERIAMFDTVTGLPNRNHFRGKCDQLLAELGEKDRGALLFLDLDQFKIVNDTLGHAAGDVLLSQVADRLRVVAERMAVPGAPMPLIGRLAGDEFTMFLSAVPDSATPDRAAAAILAALVEPFEVHGHEIKVGTSIGVARRPEHGTNLSDLMKAADAAMYFAKENGRGRAEHFGPALAERLVARAELDRDLRRAVSERQFELVFQPQVAAIDGRVVAAEALLRWRHPDDGLKLPDSFIRRAEDSGLIVEIGDWVVDSVAATLARWSADGVDQRLSINLSGRQIDHLLFFRRLRAAMAAAGAPARLLELELHETLAMACSDETLGELAALRAEGATLTMDGFGTGHSSLTRLRTLPLDRIKLDRSVVAAVVNANAARTIVHAMVGLIHGLGCEAVANGVETQAQADVLRLMGCDMLQGYAVAVPMAEDELLAWAAMSQPVAELSTAA